MNASLRRLVPYTTAMILCLLLLAGVLRLWNADLYVPFLYYGDAVWNLAWVKGLLDDGWYLHNEYLGAPGVMDMHDFPLVDSLFFLMLKLLVVATRDATFAYNLYFLLTFPLTTLTSLFVLRRFRMSAGPAVVASLLYAFLPYHFLRGEGHIFLASYFLVPLAILVMLRVYLDHRGRWLGTGVICVLLGCGGVYYAFFSNFLLLVAGTASSIQRRTLYPLVTAALLCGITSLTVGANLLPTWLYQREHGPNPAAVVRDPSGADLLGLKAAQMVLPVDHHRVHWLERVKNHYNARLAPVWYENSYSSLGLAASGGFLLLLGRLLARKPFTEPGLADGLTTLNAAALMLACVGGAGSLFSVFVSPMIRGYNRISVFIAFFALVALARLLDRLGRHARGHATRWLYRGGLTVVLGLGILDQCPNEYIPPYDTLKQMYAVEADIVGRIEATLPPGSMVYQMPALPFPEGGVPNIWFYCTDLFRPYLHSHTLRWSYGTMRGREGDRWREEVAGKPVPEMVPALVEAGFRGILVDRAGYFGDLRTSVESQLTQLLGAKPIESTLNDRYYFYDLTPYAARLQQEAPLKGTSPAAPLHPRPDTPAPVREQLPPLRVSTGNANGTEGPRP